MVRRSASAGEMERVSELADWGPVGLGLGAAAGFHSPDSPPPGPGWGKSFGFSTGSLVLKRGSQYVGFRELKQNGRPGYGVRSLGREARSRVWARLD